MEPKKKRSAAALLFVAICLFSMSSWIDINGLCTEIPLLVGLLPEGWSLPSYLAVVVQVANVAPFGYLVIKKLRPDLVKEWLASCVIIIVGVAASLLLAFTWDKTSYVGGELHSTALFVLSFFLALVDCTSTVVYLSYMARFKSSIFMTALYVGEGLSGLIPALIGLLQVSDMEPSNSEHENNHNVSFNNSAFNNATLMIQPTLRFSVSVYFIILTSMLLISLVSFCFINFHSYFDSFKTEQNSCNTLTMAKNQLLNSNKMNFNDVESFQPDGYHLSNSCHKASNHPCSLLPLTTTTPSKKYEKNSMIQNKEAKNIRYKIAFLYVLVVWISVFNYGIIPSIQSYACLPYSYLTYDLSVKLSILANPLSCFLTLILMAKRLSVISAISLLGTLMAAYQTYLAVVSSDPILLEGISGIILAIVSSVVLSSCFAYAKVCISTVLAELGGERLLLYCGVLTQVGCLIGAVTGFLLVNVVLEKR